MATVNLAHVLPPHWKETVAQWVKDDVPSFDVGGLVVGDTELVATLYCKSSGLLAGVPFFDAVFAYLGCEVEWLKTEGEFVVVGPQEKKVEVARVRGPARMLLLGERTALNTLSRCSGVASASSECMKIAKKDGWHGHVAGTRKTTPGFRIVEKYGLLVGGAWTHRLDLSQMVMLKDNHIWAAGSITEAVQKSRSAAGFSSKIEVECRTSQEAVEACEAGADVVMLDNYAPAELKRDAEMIKGRYPNVLVEASGGITIRTIADYLSPHVDIVSLGSLTQGYSAVDFSLKLPQPQQK